MTNFKKITENEFEIEVGTDFKRCSDCTNLMGRFAEFLDNNIIEKKVNQLITSFIRSIFLIKC